MDLSRHSVGIEIICVIQLIQIVRVDEQADVFGSPFAHKLLVIVVSVVYPRHSFSCIIIAFQFVVIVQVKQICALST